MGQLPHRALAAAAVSGLLLTGCSANVTGTASAADPLTAVTAQELPITGATDSEIDQSVRNALADVQTFWEQAYPEFFDEPFTPLRGGIFSVDSQNVDRSAYPQTGIGCPRNPIDPRIIAEVGPFYSPACDSIAYDTAVLEQVASRYGRLLVPVVMAHEFGHAMQGRFGFADQSIIVETQADCLAGAWVAWAADGNAEHVSVRMPELDSVLIGMVEVFRDRVGTSPERRGAHGSGFDRISAFYGGFDGGVAVCRDEFGPDRLFTQAEFDDPADEASEGNAPYDQAIAILETSLPRFYETVFPPAFGTEFQPPEIETFESTAPDCVGADLDLGYCDGTVYVDEPDLIQPTYEELGDFAVATAVAIPYALAARDQLDLSTDDGDAMRSSVCLTGWYAARFYDGDFPEVTISPGDIDEAVYFLLTHGQTARVFPDTELSGFELVGTFRDGFLNGGVGCDVGI